MCIICATHVCITCDAHMPNKKYQANRNLKFVNIGGGAASNGFKN